jgi:hypothetical protein
VLARELRAGEDNPASPKEVRPESHADMGSALMKKTSAAQRSVRSPFGPRATRHPIPCPLEPNGADLGQDCDARMAFQAVDQRAGHIGSELRAPEDDGHVACLVGREDRRLAADDHAGRLAGQCHRCLSIDAVQRPSKLHRSSGSDHRSCCDSRPVVVEATWPMHLLGIPGNGR